MNELEPDTPRKRTRLFAPKPTDGEQMLFDLVMEFSFRSAGRALENIGDGLKAMVQASRRPKAIRRPPGMKLDAFAQFVFSKRVYQTVLKPNLAETQHEYFEALCEGQLKKARWVRIRGVIGFWWTVVLQMPVSLTKLVQKLWTVSGG